MEQQSQVNERYKPQYGFSLVELPKLIEELERAGHDTATEPVEQFNTWIAYNLAWRIREFQDSVKIITGLLESIALRLDRIETKLDQR
jgi:hypothetical protein